MEQGKIERLVALLHAQRDEAARRARQVRGTTEWVDSSNRLDHLNDEIMQVGAGGPSGPDRAADAAGPSRIVGRLHRGDRTA